MKHKLFGLLRRAGLLILVVWTVVSLVNILIELVPGDPAIAVLGESAPPEQLAQFRTKHGLDRPAFFTTFQVDERCRQEFWKLDSSNFSFSVRWLRSWAPDTSAALHCGNWRWHGSQNRYVDYWRGILHGDLGTSFRTERPVVDLILERYPATIELALVAMLIAVSIAIPMGVIAGKNRGSLIDNGLSVVALVGISLPSFVIGPMLVYFFGVKLGWLAPSGRFDWSDIILPAFTLGAALSAILTRMVRSSVIEELSEGYVRTARAKGLSERKVVYKHVLKNGLIPVVTVLGLQLGVLLAGAIITEKIFGWPGLGLLLVEDGIAQRDYSVVQGCVLTISTTYILANTLTDVAYRWLDPRIRVS